jgi:hypothetical protein
MLIVVDLIHEFPEARRPLSLGFELVGDAHARAPRLRAAISPSVTYLSLVFLFALRAEEREESIPQGRHNMVSV